MAIPMLQNASGLECTVIIGPEFQCSASPDGSITIQTGNGPIVILIHRIAHQKRIQVKPVDKQRIPAVPSLFESSTSQTTFWFAENSGPEDTQQEDGNDLLGNRFSSDKGNAKASTRRVTEEASNSPENELRGGIHADLDDEDTDDRASISDSLNNRSYGKRSEPVFSDEQLTKFCQQLSTKTLEQWKSKHQNGKSLKALLADWQNIFGRMSYSSPEQWSYRTIINSETLGGLHLPFHKVILATWWNSCLEQRTSEVLARIKKRMVLTLEPDFDTLDPKLQNSKRKHIDRCIRQGEVIALMYNRAPGLVITASSSITTAEYEILWKNRHRSSVCKLDWLSEKLLQDSQLYLEPVMAILHFLHKSFRDIQLQSPNPQASFTLPQSPIELESRTDAVSSSYRAILSPKEPVPSYQTSLCGQQPSEDSIETTANTAKRRRISRNKCLQPSKVCPIPILENNGSTTQAKGQQFSTDTSIYPELQYNSTTPFEEASNIEHGRVSPNSLIEIHGDLLPISKDMEVGQWSISSADRADYDKDTNLPSYGLSDLLGHDETSYCFGAI